MKTAKPVILLLNGPNLDQLGKRDPKHYGSFTLADVERAFSEKCAELGVEPRFFQSGCEGALCHAIHEARDYASGIVINAGAYTHYSYALRDALELAKLPTVEVHISDIHSREPFRRISVIKPVCVEQVSGLGLRSYTEGLERLVRKYVFASSVEREMVETSVPSLEDARAGINLCNAEIVHVLEKRFLYSSEIAQNKIATGKAVYDPAREAEIVESVRRTSSPAVSRAAVATLKAVMRTSRESQYDLIMAHDEPAFLEAAGFPRSATPREPAAEVRRVAFAGSVGSYGAQAASKMFPGTELVPTESFAVACERVASGAEPVAVLPLANTTGGPVDTVYGLLRHRLHIVKAVDLAIRHCLAAVPGATLADVKTVKSHPQALSQCSRKIRECGWIAEQAQNTAFAAEETARKGDKTCAAICSVEAAKANGLSILCDDLCDTECNATRFVAVSRELRISANATRLGLLLELPHRAGALASALAVFDDRALNLLSICSQPVPERPWEYAFFIDVEAPALDPSAISAVYQLRRELPDLRVIGWYGLSKG